MQDFSGSWLDQGREKFSDDLGKSRGSEGVEEMMKIFSVYDAKAEAYLEPIFELTKGLAIRKFSTAAQDEKSGFCKHASDFTLYEVGTWDEQTGDVEKLEPKIPLGTALEYKSMGEVG